jgi:hypothetical protein
LHSPSSSVLFKELVFAYHCWIYHIRLSIPRTMQSSSSFNNQPAIIHTDGSPLNAQTASSGAGFGVFFGEGDARNIAATLCKYDKGYSALSNDYQRPELAGIRQGLRSIAECPMTQMYILKTNSQDSIARIMGRLSNRNRNTDLVRDCMRLYDRDKRKYEAKLWDFTIQYVEWNKNDANSLAREGAWQDMEILGRKLFRIQLTICMKLSIVMAVHGQPSGMELFATNLQLLSKPRRIAIYQSPLDQHHSTGNI